MAVPSNMYLGEQTDDQHHDIHDQLYQGSKQIDNALADHREVIEDAGKEIGDAGAASPTGGNKPLRPAL